MTVTLRTFISDQIHNGKKLSLDILMESVSTLQGYKYYRSCLRFHLGVLKLFRRSDRQSLQWLRQVYLQVNILTLNKEPTWRVDRQQEENEQLLGINFRRLLEVQREFLAEHDPNLAGPRGMSDPKAPIYCRELGPGNCISMYQMTSPGVVRQGSADALFFSVDGTLKNCLHSFIRFDHDQSIDSLFSDYSLEINNKFNHILLKILREDDQETFRAWEKAICKFLELVQNGKTVNISELHGFFGKIDSNVPTSYRTSNEQSVVQTMLVIFGIFVDLIANKLFLINGMGFWYKELQEYLATIIVFKDEFKQILESLDNDDDFLNVLDELKSICEKMIDMKGGSDREVLNKEWEGRHQYCFREFRKAISKSVQRNQSESPCPLSLKKQIDSFLFLENYLWRWKFFVDEQTRRSNSLNVSESVERIKQWLGKPWAIIRKEEFDLAFFDILQQCEDQNEFLLVFNNLFKDGLASFVEYLDLGRLDGIHEKMDLMIISRLLIVQINRCRFRLDVEEWQKMHQQAWIIINTFTAWIQEPEQKEIFLECETDPNRIVDILNNSEWASQYISKPDLNFLTRHQFLFLKDFIKNPKETLDRYFIFNNEDFSIGGYIDVYPPEDFIFEKWGVWNSQDTHQNSQTR